tara:strand:+ start:2242 stop:5520 length:3279 start_codon:yes stop_codon:yes gene_type:complete
MSQTSKGQSKDQSNDLLNKYLLIYLQGDDNRDELEIRFGTNYKNPITKIKFHNVIEKLKSLGFTISKNNHYLNINNEYTDPKTGSKKISNIRTEIHNTHNIKNYCNTNNLNLEKSKGRINDVYFTQKFRKKNVDEVLMPIDFKDFEFRVNYKTERTLRKDHPSIQKLLSSWSDEKKIFRLIKRLTFQHHELPFNFDLSIVKSSKKSGPRLISEYNIQSSDVFNNPETYEVEVEIDNKRKYSFTNLNIDINSSIRKCIKIILSALQKTNYPISYREQNLVKEEYMNVIYDNQKPDRPIFTTDFVGPSSISLEMIHTIPISDDHSYPNIRQPYTVTDKADGYRALLYISSIGKIYLINTNMEIIFTGCVSKNEDCYSSIIDGEHVERDKHNNYINYFLCFDIYYLKNKSVREFPFLKMDGLVYHNKKMSKEIFRFNTLNDVINSLNIVPISSQKPMTIKVKTFYQNTSKDIFTQCREILQKEEDGQFLYETDGLIFTPINTGVSSDKIGVIQEPKKITWLRSFKWKPPEFNTIDFLVTTNKDETGNDIIKNKFSNGVDYTSDSQIIKYKILTLNVGFDERKHGFMNPCKNIFEDNLPNPSSTNISSYRPVPFQPTNPTPMFPAYICNINLSHKNKMLTENGSEFFEDKTIVEFRYDKTKQNGWQWIPIRVRNDKTADFKKGLRNYGNAYHVANSVWQSIHNPVTKSMITTGNGIPDEIVENDVYYNTKKGDTITRSLRDFHNKFVKRKLILAVSNKGDTLMDQSVGKAGDFPKWKAAKLNFIFGIDYSKDNIENRIDGACARYLREKMKWNYLPKVLYLHGDSSKNIRNGNAFIDQKSKQIAKAVFGQGVKDRNVLGKGVFKQYGKGDNGFDVVSNQFSIHYFFGNKINLNNFLRNVSECCKVGGYFIGTCYDGKRVFNALRDKKLNESITINQDGRKMWQINKNYIQTEFRDDDSSLGYTISVYQESINKTFPEFLVNFDYLTELIENYGFTPLTQDEAAQLDFVSSIGSFSLLFDDLKKNIKQNSRLRKIVGTSTNMNHNEKKISFLNNYFIFRKRRPVNAESVFNSIIKTKSKKKLKFRKLKTKIKLTMKK